MSQQSDLNSLEDTARDLLGVLPDRWGRMDMMSRTALVEIGKTLQAQNLLGDTFMLKESWTGGLIVGSANGSLAVDLEYAATLKEGPGMASPHLFGYTLPNIPLAEAAIAYGLTGPVFSLISEEPYDEAVDEAHRWLEELPEKNSFIVAGALDVTPSDQETKITAKFNVLQN